MLFYKFLFVVMYPCLALQKPSFRIFTGKSCETRDLDHPSFRENKIQDTLLQQYRNMTNDSGQDMRYPESEPKQDSILKENQINMYRLNLLCFLLHRDNTMIEKQKRIQNECEYLIENDSFAPLNGIHMESGGLFHEWNKEIHRK